MQLIPAIDLRDGHCVRLLQGDFDRETRYTADPLPIVRAWRDAGCQALHVVDLDGARYGEARNRDSVARLVAGSGLAVQVGGGIRDRDAVAGWLDAGVARVVIGSAAVDAPAETAGWLRDFGAERIVLALDCRLDADGRPQLTTHGWTRDAGLTLWDGVERYRDAGLRHVLCTDVGRDGALTGPSLDLYADFAARFPEIALQASGGVRRLDDLAALRVAGAAAAISGRALLDGRISNEEMTSFLQSA